MKKCITAFVLVALAAMAVGCGPSKYRFREIEAYHQPLPFKEATMYPGSAVNNNVAVAAMISNEDTQKRLFSYEIESLGVLPVMVTLTNNSKRPVLALVNECHLVTGDAALKPENAQKIVKKAMAKTRGGEIAMIVAMPMTFFFASGEIKNDLQTIDEAKRIGIYNRLIRETVVAPGQTVVGYVFFDKKAATGSEKTLQMEIQKLDKVEYFTIETKVSG